MDAVETILKQYNCSDSYKITLLEFNNQQTEKVYTKHDLKISEKLIPSASYSLSPEEIITIYDALKSKKISKRSNY